MNCFIWIPLTIVSLLLLLLECVKSSDPGTYQDELYPEYWQTMAKSVIRERLRMEPNKGRARNVILFLGDGMGPTTVTPARILNGQLQNQSGEESSLVFDHFPYTAMIKTYNLNKQVPDSAGTATAYLTGVKGNYGTLGVSGVVNQHTKDCELVHKSALPSVMDWALKGGKWAGLVTTTRVTHATPGASYAHTQNRDFEGFVPGGATSNGECQDIALQLIKNFPGNELNVVLGGGRAKLLPNTEFDPKGALVDGGKLEPVRGERRDGRNLINEWTRRKLDLGFREDQFAYVNSTGSLRKQMEHAHKLKYLFGLFNHTHMEYETLRDRSNNGEPSLTEMTESALKVLSNSPDGFVLLVEGGRIDHAHHSGYAKMALLETLEFNRAIEKSLELVNKSDTLIIVTADHSHSLTMNGYPDRGNPIDGIGDSDSNGIPFQTLLYGNGPGYRTLEERKNILNESFAGDKYQHHSAIPLKESHHGGEDVALYATGPMAHLFGGTQEQNVIAHVMAFASCIDVYRDEAHCQPTPT